MFLTTANAIIIPKPELFQAFWWAFPPITSSLEKNNLGGEWSPKNADKNWPLFNKNVVGGWTNPSEKYDLVKIGNLPQGENQKMFELPPPRSVKPQFRYTSWICMDSMPAKKVPQKSSSKKGAGLIFLLFIPSNPFSSFNKITKKKQIQDELVVERPIEKYYIVKLDHHFPR